MTSYPDLQLYIDGAWRKTADDLPVVDPATEAVIGRLPHASISDLDDALTAAGPPRRRRCATGRCSHRYAITRGVGSARISVSARSVLTRATRWVVPCPALEISRVTLAVSEGPSGA